MANVLYYFVFVKSCCKFMWIILSTFSERETEPLWKRDSISNFCFLWWLLSGSCGRDFLPLSCHIRVHDTQLRQTSLCMIVLVPPSVEPPCVGSPARPHSLTTSSCWIKSSVSTLATCQQGSALAACLRKHNCLYSFLSSSNKEGDFRTSEHV